MVVLNTSLSNLAACVRRMSCTADIEDRFGPVVSSSCLNGFDFTLLFEEAFLTIVPLVIASAWATLRAAVLRNEPVKVRTSWLLPCKLLFYAIHEALQTTILALWASDGRARTRLSLACVSLTTAAYAFFALVSYVEHKRSVRPSTMLILYLGVTLILDLARTRTLFFTAQGLAAARVNLAALIVKLGIFVLENIEKRSMVKKAWQEIISPEGASGVINRATFLWLNTLVVQGFRTLLTVHALPSLDNDILAASRPSELLSEWKNGESVWISSWHQVIATPIADLISTVSPNAHEHGLLWLFVKHFKWATLAGVLPRLACAGFTFAQPYLVKSLLDFTADINASNRSSTAYALVGAYAIAYVGLALTYAVYQHKTYRLLTLYRGALVAMIFDKTLRVEASSVDDAEAVTLMSADIDRTTGSMHVVHELYASVIEAGIAFGSCTTFLVSPWFRRWHGWLFAVCVLAAGPIAKASGNAQVPWLEAIEDRLASTAKALSSMKAIKMTGLADLVASYLANSRLVEIRASRRHRILNIFVFISSIAPYSVCLIVYGPVWGFLTYILIAKTSAQERTLTEGVAFGALSLFELLQQPVQYAVNGVEDAQILINSFRRIQAYLASPDRHDYRRVLPSTSASVALGHEVNTIKPYQDEFAFVVKEASARFNNESELALRNLSFKIPHGQTTIIYGRVGCGKTALLKPLLGELSIASGSVETACQQSAYCSQSAWCNWGTVRDNIIGMSSWNEEWYRMVITACALLADIEQLPMGDNTHIGTKGSQLSGGQKSRVSLARAIYSRSPILLLDGILPGLDRTTEQYILSAVFGDAGILARSNTTVVLASSSDHHIRLADHLIVLNADGTMAKYDSQEMIGHSDDKHLSLGNPGSPSPVCLSALEQTHHEKQDIHLAQDHELQDSRKTGDMKVYTYYARIAGWPMITVYLFASAILVFGVTFPSVWLQWRTNANATHPNERIGYWVGTFAALGVLTLVGCAIADSAFNLAVLPTTSRRFHEILLDTTMNASMAFLTSTDTGTTLNRFSQDLELIDNDLPEAINQTVFQLMSTFVTAAFVFSGSGYIAAAIPVCFILITSIALFYLRTSRQMRLLDIEAKAPLFSLFLEVVSGIESIRAYGWTALYIEQNRKALDLSQRPYYLLFCLQRWLTLVLDLFNASIAIVLVAIATNVRNGSTAFLGVALFNIVIFSSTIQSLVTEWTQVEAALGAINRIRTYERSVHSEHLPGENSSLPHDWPKHGAITFEGLTASYTSSKKPTLQNISFRIEAGAKVAICGRTGSGKSSLIATLLRTIEIHSGTISIDGMDIASIPRREIRRRLNTLPQEPFFLPGSVRTNMDPRGEATDERLGEILQKVHLWEGQFDGRDGLDGDMNEGILSHGQQQLFCLGRALVKPGSITIMDEATGSVDDETSGLMQGILRDGFQGRTVVAVVHKLHEILDFDLVVVLDQGRIIETGRPSSLLRQDASAFKTLYETAGYSNLGT
ncbi:ABC multidrug transporter B [Fulvia fulva]|uniref:ABC multidrug transporter B n=1 Tax=Passalora fulva TaxID=5499 RepID=A0A9Q8P8N6_PASFU|nr:ABC multidrug transporter B [Fulvia fulva]UJO17086.1 ABC multidrug transporter B [Fulvia fulva]WPV28214.1 ABC multidrug transporter B [Fulvia fulva]